MPNYRGSGGRGVAFSKADHRDLGGKEFEDVIAGIDWVVANKDTYDIRVMNVSLGHTINEYAQLDPLVQAVEQAWQAGIVVVASVGNHGRDGYFTVTSPGNSRRVITVGSLTDYRNTDPTDDMVSSYSSRGPTPLDHYAKPDLIAPGNRIIHASGLNLNRPTLANAINGRSHIRQPIAGGSRFDW